MSSRPRQRAPPRVAIHSTSSAVSQRAGSGSDAVREQRLARLGQHVRAVVAGRAVHAEADRRARVEQRAHGRDAGAEPEVRATGSARRRCPSRRTAATSSRVQVDAVGEPDVRAEPAQPAQVLDRPAAVHLQAVRVLVAASPRGACAGARRARAPGPRVRRIRSSVTENGEQGASAMRVIAPGRGSWYSRMSRRRVGEDRVLVLHDVVRAAGRPGSARGSSSRAWAGSGCPARARPRSRRR